MRRVPVLLAASLSTAFIWGCTSVPSQHFKERLCDRPLPEVGNSTDVRYWSFLRFRFARDENGATRSFLDPLVAHEVLAPLLETYRANIGMWRFHRRWPNDEVGHQFSLLILTDVETARAIKRAIEQDAILATLARDGQLRETVFDIDFDEERTELAATSDSIWPLPVQQEWPKFAEGASRMWLGLVGIEAARHVDEPLEARYRHVEEALNQLWFTQANHAFFHHLSAMFGYQPMRVLRREIMTF